LANVHYLRADFTAGWACLEASRVTAGDHWDAGLESDWRYVGGQLALHEGRHELARQLLAEELEATGKHSGTLYTGYLFMNLGTVAREQREYAEADGLLMQGLQMAERNGDKTLLAHSLEGLSGLASALGRHERALCLGSAGAALRETIGAPLSPAWRRMVVRWMQVSRTALSDDHAASACNTGQEMLLNQVIAYAYAQAPSVPTSSDIVAAAQPKPTRSQSPLTQREQEVAALVARGLSNRELAERLVITTRTAENHLSHILDKLELTSRTQVATWAVEHGLLLTTPA
jgi:non-specific serine/threonine protein kinase